ncbi:MAG: hypothetical protein GX049_11880 [Alcaligenaceae bacterium]|nr:hypothetical protein [Alcaligenaceae bacterium]
MYTVTLEGYSESSLPERARREAEDRFRRTLERSLGGPEAVTAAYKAWQNAEETSESELSPEIMLLARQWQAGATRAYQSGFTGLGENPEAWFDVRLER